MDHSAYIACYICSAQRGSSHMHTCMTSKLVLRVQGVHYSQWLVPNRGGVHTLHVTNIKGIVSRYKA